MFSILVYLKKAFPDDWGERARAYNEKFMHPPLSPKDVAATVRSLTKKQYSYQCRQQPIVSFCERSVCLTCPHGVGGHKNDPGVVFGPLILIRTDPPTWLWDVDGERLELGTEELMDQRRFQRSCVERLKKWPAFMKEGVWREMICEKLAEAEERLVPEDATKRGQLWALLEKFCTGRVTARSLDELLLGKPWTDLVTKRVYFVASDFIDYARKRKATISSEKELYMSLMDRGIQHHECILKGEKHLSYWSVPAFGLQTEPHDVPRSKERPM